MVFGTFARFSRYSRACFEDARGSAPFSPRYTGQPFFYPSYKKRSEVAEVDEVAHHRRKRDDTKSGKYSYKYSTIMPALTVTRNYVIFDPSSNKRRRRRRMEQEEEAHEDPASRRMQLQKIILRRVNHHPANGNGHLRINLESIDAARATLSIRRAHSSVVKRVNIATDGLQKRGYATEAKQQEKYDMKKLEEQISKLQINDEEVNEKPTSVNVEMEEIQGVSQEQFIDTLIEQGKTNEILSVFTRMRGNNVVPTIDVYNKVLSSIPQRTTDETDEQRLTHLLNVYSDMLSNDIKPDNDTYELVIRPLLDGALNSYAAANFKDGSDFLKLAMELFKISHSDSAIKFSDPTTYNKLVESLNKFQMVEVDVAHLYDALTTRVGESIDFHLQMIRLASLKGDFQSVQKFYHALQHCKSAKLQSSQYQIYRVVIEALNFCGETGRSSVMLDRAVASIEDVSTEESQDLISSLLSSYIESQAWINPAEAYKTICKFNEVDWLPEISLASVLNVFASCLNAGDLNLACKAWDFAIIRLDFDSSVNQLGQTTNYMMLSGSLDRYLSMILARDDQNMVLKTMREILIKQSLSLSDTGLVETLKYLEGHQFYDIATRLVIDQGLKRNAKDQTTLNNYLSLVVDLITPQQMAQLWATKYFKKTVEQYRVTKDNVYGLIKMFDTLATKLSSKMELRLKYYSKVLQYEFDDTANFYVKLPEEIQKFKTQVAEIAK